MKRYELAVVLHPDLEIDLKGAKERLTALFTKTDGKVINSEDWGKQKLAYPIKKQNFGIYQFYTLDLPPQKVNELERELVLDEELLRHLLIIEPDRTVEEPKEKPKPAVKKVSKVKVNGEE